MSSPDSKLTLFAFGDEKVRVMADVAGEPWFVAADVCRVLDINNASLAINGRPDREDDGLEDDEKGIATVNTLGGEQKFITVNESGLYSLVFKSRKPEAKAFKRWVTKEVIPSIRKTGQYVAAPAVPMTYRDAVAALLAQIEEKEALALENAELKPKADFFDAVASSEDALGMNETAKLLGHGRNKLMAALRRLKVFRHNNTPYQDYINVAPAEYYPSSEQWGKKGWTFTDKDSALRKMELLTEAKP